MESLMAWDLKSGALSPAVVLAMLCITIGSPGAAQEPSRGAQVYREAVASVVWIQSKTSKGMATGSGALIDTPRRLVLTNYHVVEDEPKATVFFPEFRDGLPIAERKYYVDRAARLGVPGKVVAKDPARDLALVELERLPAGLRALPLAAGSPAPGETIHSIGNAGSSGALWGYVRGTVRSVYRKTWQARLGSGRLATFQARIIEADSPTNPGDSGGPLLNDRGEIIGVTQGGVTNANSVSYFVDLAEILALLRREKLTLDPARVAASPPSKKESPPSPPAGPLAPKDAAKLFEPARLKQLEPEFKRLHEAGVDVLLETMPRAPETIRSQWNSADAMKRQELLKSWAEERLGQTQRRGLIILIAQDPRVFHVYGHPELTQTLKNPTATLSLVVDTLRKSLRANVPEDGLAESLRILLADLKNPPAMGPMPAQPLAPNRPSQDDLGNPP